MDKQLRLILLFLSSSPTFAAFEMVLMPMVSKWAVIGGTPISQDMLPLMITKPGKYVFIEPLSNDKQTGSAIKISTANTTIDLNGFTLDWPNGKTGILIHDGLHNIRIQNGAIQQAQYGISGGSHGSEISIKNMTITDCSTVGLCLAEGCNNIVIADSTFARNGSASNGPALVTDSELIGTFSSLLYLTADTGHINDRGWYTLSHIQQPISAGAYIRGTPEEPGNNIQIRGCRFNDNNGNANVAGLVVAFADNVQLNYCQCTANVTTTSGLISRNAGTLFMAVHNGTVDDCMFAENISAGDGVPSGLCLQGLAINDDTYKTRCSTIKIANCVAKNNHRSLAGAPALDVHGSNFDTLWSDGITFLNCQSSHAARLFQVQECANVSYVECEAMGGLGSDIPWQIANGFRGFANHQSANIIHERCRVFNLDQNNAKPSSFQGAEGFYAAVQDVVSLAGTKRVGVGMSASPFDMYMTVTPLTGLVYRDCVVDHLSDASISKSNAFGITLRGCQNCFISNCVMNSAQRINPAGMIISGTGISLEDATETADGSSIIGGPCYNQNNWVVNNEIFGCQTGIGDVSNSTATPARCAYLGNTVFRAEFPFGFAPELVAATPILIWPLSSGKQPPSLDSTGNPATQWTNLAIQ